MTTKIQKWGNSLGVRIPKDLAREVNIREGSVVSFSVEGDMLVLSRPKKQKYSIEELVEGITRENTHTLLGFGPDVGAEVLPQWENK